MCCFRLQQLAGAVLGAAFATSNPTQPLDFASRDFRSLGTSYRKNSIRDVGGGRSFARLECWNGGALGENLISFERFVLAAVGSFYGGRAGGVESEEFG